MLFVLFVFFYLFSDGAPLWVKVLALALFVVDEMREGFNNHEEAAWKQSVLRLLADIAARRP